MIDNVGKVFPVFGFMAMGLCYGGDANEIRMVPTSVEIVYADTGKQEKKQPSDDEVKMVVINSGDIHPGTELGIKLVASDEDALVYPTSGFEPYFSPKKENQTWTLTDSNGKDLGSSKSHRDKVTNWSTSSGNPVTKEEYEYYHGGPESRYKLSFNKYPSRGATSLYLKGDYPVIVSYKRPPTKPVALKLKIGEKIEAEPFKIKVFSIETWEEMEKRREEERRKERRVGDKQVITIRANDFLFEREGFNYCIQLAIEMDKKKYSFEELVLTDSKGAKISCKSGRMSVGSIRAYAFSDISEDIYVSVQYRELEKENIPLDLKFDLMGGK